jgi:hypothetical protein
MKKYVEWMYRSMFSLPRHQLEATGQHHAPAALSLEKKLNTHPREGWVTPDTVWTIRRSKNSLPYRDSNYDCSVVQLIASLLELRVENEKFK